MLQKSRVIVLGSVKYGDSSIILKSYSKDYGLLSFIVGGVRGKKGKLKSSIAMPLNQFEVVFYPKSKGELKRLKEVSHHQLYEQLFYDPIKNCLSMFLAEVLSHVLHEEEAQPDLFDYLSSSIYYLDSLDKGVANFHLFFLYRLSSFLGFKPQKAQEKGFFDLSEGNYYSSEPLHSHFLKEPLLKEWKKLDGLELEDLESFQLSSTNRSMLLEALIDYFRLHIKDFGNLKSIDVLHTVLH
jgi:DNA repair protein RecO (recombination protein O)